jgi:hypothetical protein
VSQGSRQKLKKQLSVALFVLVVTGCAPNPNDVALELGQSPLEKGETTTSLRVLQTRSFATSNTSEITAAGMATLQDLGFTIEAASNEFGVITGSKDRDAVEGGQVAAQVALTILAALAGSSHTPTYDESQKIKATLVVNKIDDGASEVRIFFDRQITNNLGQLWKADLIKAPEIYQEFFAKLSQSAFFEEQGL